MLRSVRGLVSGRVVSAATLREMITSRTDGLEASTDYGYGFILSDGGGASSFGHGGTATGVDSELRHFPDRDLTVIAFSDQDNGAYDDLRRNALKLATGER